MRCSPTPSGSNRHRSTALAFWLKIAKLTPAPSHVAPSGYGLPRHTLTVWSRRALAQEARQINSQRPHQAVHVGNEVAGGGGDAAQRGHDLAVLLGAHRADAPAGRGAIEVHEPGDVGVAERGVDEVG